MMKTWNDAHLKETFCLVEWMGVYLKWWILATFFVDYPQKNHYYLKEKYKWSMIKVMITVLYVLDNYIMLEGSPQIKCVYLFYSCRSYLLPICKTNQNWLELVQLKKTSKRPINFWTSCSYDSWLSPISLLSIFWLWPRSRGGPFS